MSNPADSPWDTPGITQRLRELHRLEGEGVTMPVSGPWHLDGINERLVELYARTGMACLSMRGISYMLSEQYQVPITRNAVIGRCHRLGLASRPSPLKHKVKRKRKWKKRVRVRHVVVNAPLAPAAPLPAGAALTIIQLRDGVCHWPLGNLMETRPPYLYCGKPTADDRTWCPEHDAIGHVKAKVSLA